MQDLSPLCKTKQTNAYATFKLFYWISEACLTLVFTSQYVIRQLPAYIVRQQKVCSKKGEKVKREKPKAKHLVKLHWGIKMQKLCTKD